MNQPDQIIDDETEQNAEGISNTAKPSTTEPEIEENTGSINEPAWLRKLTPKLTAEHPQTEAILKPLATVLAQLPAVAATHNKAAMENYYQQVSRELLRVYYVRMRLIFSSTTLSAAQKDKQFSALSKTYKKQLHNVAVALGDYNE